MDTRFASCIAAVACVGIVASAAPPMMIASATARFELNAKMPPPGNVDPVVEWHQIFNDVTLATTPVPSSLVASRSAAMVSAAVFDAVNGVDRWYRPLHVTERAPARASAGAAAIQAAYAMLIRLYPAQAMNLTARRDASMALLTASEPPYSVEQGVGWGQHVADIIWLARQGDGLTPTMAPFMGSATLGFWRPTPPAHSPGAGPQFATMTPWVLTRPSQFRPAPPPALSGQQYADDYNETKMWGGAVNSLRQPEDSAIARFWSGNGTLFWTRVASQLAVARHLTSQKSAHLFAVLHVALADASMATWDAKYRYVFWRPVTAIRSLDNDGNDGTTPDPEWMPFLTTSAHPEYPSGHANLAGAAATVLSAMFGDDVVFDVTSETMPGVRSFVGFDGAVEEMADARVYGGMHFRNACTVGSDLGKTVAAYVVGHAMGSRRQHVNVPYDNR